MASAADQRQIGKCRNFLRSPLFDIVQFVTLLFLIS